MGRSVWQTLSHWILCECVGLRGEGEGRGDWVHTECMCVYLKGIRGTFSSHFSPTGHLSRQHSLMAPHRTDFRRPSLGFEATSAQELAEILSSLDYKLFRRIPVSV